MTVDSQQDIDGVLNAGRVVASVRDAMLSAVEPGMTTAELNKLGGELLNRCGAKSAPRVTYNFPGATCISINEEAAHGIPGDRMIQPGDIVNVDFPPSWTATLPTRVAQSLFRPSQESRRVCVMPLDWLWRTR